MAVTALAPAHDSGKAVPIGRPERGEASHDDHDENPYIF